MWKSSYVCTGITDPNKNESSKDRWKRDTIHSHRFHPIPCITCPLSCVYSRFGRIRSVSVESIRCKCAAPQLRPSRLLLLRPLDEDVDSDVEKDEEDVDPSLRRVRIVLRCPPPNEDSPFLMWCMDEDNRFNSLISIVVLALRNPSVPGHSQHPIW